MYDIRDLIDKSNPPLEHRKALIDAALAIYKIARAIPKYSALDKVAASVYLAYEQKRCLPPRDIKPKFGALSAIRKAAGIPQMEAADMSDELCRSLNLDDFETISKGAKNILHDYMEKDRNEYDNNPHSVVAAVAVNIASKIEGISLKDSEFQTLGFARHLISRKSKTLAEKLGYGDLYR